MGADGQGKTEAGGLEGENGGADDETKLPVKELGHGGKLAVDVLEEVVAEGRPPRLGGGPGEDAEGVDDGL